MRSLFFALICLLMVHPFFFNSLSAQVVQAQPWPYYEQNDLGLSYSPAGTRFKVWAPLANEARLRLYRESTGGSARLIEMQPGAQGTWQAYVEGDCEGMYYTYQVRNLTSLGYVWSEEVSDPYAIATGVNGLRAAIVDIKKTDPPGWDRNRLPAGKVNAPVIIYELHVRDASMDASAGIRQKGKFLGLAETGTKNSFGASTGLDHLSSLGVTHVHLLPFFDFRSSDESSPLPPYNWGYDPLHYNAPEGTYATDVSDPAVRIRELKTMIHAFHQKGLKVVMDVVYNHTGLTETSHFEQLVPGYYFRRTAEGKFSNASACGNETASEAPMFRKFMLESLLFWVKEYHLDGFRFDLMGIHDIATMNEIARTLRRHRPDLLLYGEGWTAGSSPLPDSVRALKKEVNRLEQIAVFGDEFRDGLKGSVFDYHQPGFVSGAFGNRASIQFGVVGAVSHPQIDFDKVNYSKAPYATSPRQMIAYADCHDNHTLWDRLTLSAASYSEVQRKKMHQLALAMVLTSQGIPFLHAGSEFLRSKKGNENSYNAPDSINAIDWNLKSIHQDHVAMVQALIAMRKKHAAFQLTDPAARIRFIDSLPEGVVAFVINATGLDDPWKKILVIYNGRPHTVPFAISAAGAKGKWRSFLYKNQPDQRNKIKPNDTFQLGEISCTILYQ
ncbi:MAG: type I pullulanase [Chitinophagia bacterium]|nr:type I pullulanase [Chitinophagia bacterium]